MTLTVPAVQPQHVYQDWLEHRTEPKIVKRIPALYTKVLDEDQGIVEEIFAVMGNIDHGKDRIFPGSFKKTLTERGGQVLVLDMHQTDSILRVIGKPIEIREIGKNELPQEIRLRFPDATGAVIAKTQYLLETPEGLGAFQRIKAGAIKELSFGFDIVDDGWSTVKARKTEDGWQLDPNGDDLKVRDIRAVRLYEYSRVLWGMNPATSTVSVKSADPGPEDEKTIVPYQNLPLADREAAWDQAAARRRVKEWAGGDSIDFAKYKRAFVWIDPNGDKETEGAYKFPIADVIDGTLTAVFRAVSAAAGRIGSIPEGERAAAQNHLGRYYKKAAAEYDDETIVAPWAKAKSYKSISLTRLVSEIEGDFMEQFNPPDDCTYWPIEVFDDHLIAGAGWGRDREFYSVSFTIDGDGNVQFAPRAQWIKGSFQFVPDAGQQQQPAGADAPAGGDQPAEDGGDGEGDQPMSMATAVSPEEKQALILAAHKLLALAGEQPTQPSESPEAPPAGEGAAPDKSTEPNEKQTTPEAGPAMPPTEAERIERIKELKLEKYQTEAKKTHGK